jgi:microcystin-dependent protein
MSDLTPSTGEVVSPQPAASGATPSPIPDDSLPAVAEQLRPLFAEAMKAAVAEALAAVPIPTLRPGTVKAMTTTGIASVQMDGDTAVSDSQVIGETPTVNERVMVLNLSGISFVVGIVGGGGVPAATVAAYAGTITADASGSSTTSPPSGWLWCHGQAVAQASYPRLFANVGATYNIGGEANTDFRIPDYRDRYLVGVGNMGGAGAGLIGASSSLGAVFGSNTIATTNLPAHNHDGSGFSISLSVSTTVSTSISDPSHGHSYGNDAGRSASGWPTSGGGGFPWTYSDPGGITVGNSTTGITASSSASSSGTGSLSGTTGNTGSGTEFLPPSRRVHFIIKA